MLDIPKVWSWQGATSERGDPAILFDLLPELDLQGTEITPFWFDENPQEEHSVIIGSDVPVCEIKGLPESILKLAQLKKSLTLVEVNQGVVQRVTYCQPRERFQPLVTN